MRVIDLDSESPNKRVTVLSYGAMRSGKTRWAATFPRPLFLSDNTETGWTTIKHMDPNSFFEPGRKPDVWSLEKASDMAESLKRLEDALNEQPGKYLTVVVDSLTFYADLYFNMLDGIARSGNRTPDNRKLFMDLAAHMREVRIRVHNMNINVVWLCLEKQPTAEEPTGGPMLSGQSAQKFAAGCDYVFYHRSFQLNPTRPLEWDIRTRRFNQYPAGGRDGGLVPDPLGFIEEVEIEGETKQNWVPDCTYRTLAMALNISESDSLSTPPPPVNTLAVPLKTVSPIVTAAPGGMKVQTVQTITLKSKAKPTTNP